MSLLRSAAEPHSCDGKFHSYPAEAHSPQRTENKRFAELEVGCTVARGAAFREPDRARL